MEAGGARVDGHPAQLRCMVSPVCAPISCSSGPCRHLRSRPSLRDGDLRIEGTSVAEGEVFGPRQVRGAGMAMRLQFLAAQRQGAGRICQSDLYMTRQHGMTGGKRLAETRFV